MDIKKLIIDFLSFSFSMLRSFSIQVYMLEKLNLYHQVNTVYLHRDASPCQISSKVVNPLRRYSNFSFFHDGFLWGLFGLSMENTWRSLSLCKIWF